MQSDNLHKGAGGKQFEYARNMRKAQTAAEEILWQNLRNKKIHGLKFRRQHPVDKYIADFYCHEAKLVIEVDGGVHEEMEQREYDASRTYELKELGIKIIRFKNYEIENSLDKVLEEIKKHLTPTLS